MSLWRRKPVRVLAILLAVLLLAVAAVKIFLPAEKIRDLALAQARQRLGREVTVQDVSVSLRGGLGVKLTRVAVHNPPGFAGEPLLAAGSLDLKLAIKPLFKKQVQVSRLVLEGPALNLAVQADGSNNFTFEPVAAAQGAAGDGGGKAQGAVPSASITVPNLAVRGGKVVYGDARAEGKGVSRIQVDNLELDLSLDSTPDGGLAVKGKARTPGLAITGPQPVPTLEVTGDYDLVWQPDPAGLILNTVSARVGGLPLTASGRIDLTAANPAGKIDLQLPEQPLTGLRVLAAPELAGKIEGGADRGSVRGSVEITLTGRQEDPLHTSGQAALRDVDLALAQPFLPPEKKAAVAGRADLDLTFALLAPDPEQLTYRGQATVRGMSYTQPDLMDQLQSLDGELEITPDRYTVTRCRARFASGAFDLTGSLRDPLPYFLPPELQEGKTMKTPHLEFRLQSRKLDVDRLLPAASPARGGVQGKAAPRRALPPIEVEFPDITCRGAFAADTLIYMQMPLTRIAGKVAIRNRVLECYDVTGALYGGTLSAGVNIDLKDLNTPAYAGTYQAQGIEVDQFLARFVDLRGVVFGAVGMQGSFSARGRDPETIQRGLTLDSEAGLSQGKVITSGNTYTALNKLAGQLGQTLDQEQALRDLATSIHVKDGKVGIKDLKTRLGQLGDVTFGGTYAFTGELDYRGQILLTEAATTRLFSTGVLAELGKLLGSQKPQRLALPLTVGGVRTDPQVQFDLARVTADLQDRVVKEQGNKLENEAKNKLNDLLKKFR